MLKLTFFVSTTTISCRSLGVLASHRGYIYSKTSLHPNEVRFWNPEIYSIESMWRTPYLPWATHVEDVEEITINQVHSRRSLYTRDFEIMVLANILLKSPGKRTGKWTEKKIKRVTWKEATKKRTMRRNSIKEVWKTMTKTRKKNNGCKARRKKATGEREWIVYLVELAWEKRVKVGREIVKVRVEKTY